MRIDSIYTHYMKTFYLDNIIKLKLYKDGSISPQPISPTPHTKNQQFKRTKIQTRRTFFASLFSILLSQPPSS